jgi:hypothetical protein
MQHFNISTNFEMFRGALGRSAKFYGEKLIDKYLRANASSCTIATMQSSMAMLCSSHIPPRSRKTTDDAVFWISLGYHPLWRSVLRKALRRATCPNEKYQFQVSWRNELPTVQSFVNANNKLVMAKHLQGRSFF